MKTHRHLLAVAAVAVVATVGLAACNGDGSGGMGVAMNSPQPQQPDQPDQPPPAAPPTLGTESFSGFVLGQFQDGTRNSNTATPAKVGSMKFKFDHENDPHAFDSLFAKSPGNGG